MALSLGRNRGAALVGRPLDMAVMATLDSQDDVAAMCVDADVFYADSQIEKSRVRVSVEKAATGPQDAVIRIRSSVLIDEPVVTIYLRAGCQQKIEKRFVVLADLVSETAADPLPVIVAPSISSSNATPIPSGNSVRPAQPASSGNQQVDASAPVAPPLRTRRRPAPAASTPAAPVSGTVATPKTEAAVAVPATAAEGKPKSRSQRAREERAAAKTGARLKLEPLDLTVDRDPTLKSSSEMLSVPASSEQERSAAAALWRALNAQPQDILQEAEKVNALETSVRTLRAQMQKNQQSIDGLNGQLQKAEAERYANLVVYGLALLLLLALVAVAWLWRKRSLLMMTGEDELPWWRKNKPSEKGWSNSLLESDASTPPAQAGRADGGKPGSVALDLDLGQDQSGFTEVKHLSGHGSLNSLSPSTDRMDFAASMTTPLRAVKAEELFDVQQQADFFVSLGQHEQAINVLRGHILDHGQTSALVYLDLFNLYHQLNREADYEALRQDFNQRFNAKMPSFELYADKGAGLESYSAALSRIEALWPSPRVLEVIEESIFRKPDTDGSAFDLEAYRELLLLYAVAREIITPDGKDDDSLLSFDLPDSSFGDQGGRPSDFGATAIQPLSASVADHVETTPVPVSVLPPASPRLGLDIDLSDSGPGLSASEAAPAESPFFAQFVNSSQEDNTLSLAPVTPPAAREQAPAPAAPAPSRSDNLINFDSFEPPLDLPKPGRTPKN
jgi:hypothetical protein